MIRALTFDVVGTLIDFEAGILRCVRGFSSVPDDGSVLAAFGAAEDVQQRRTPELPFPAMLDPIGERLAADLGIPELAGSPSPLRESIASWPAFPDAAEVLGRWRDRFRLVALTNADRAAVAAWGPALGDPFHDTVTVDEVGVNKPDPRMFEAALDKLAGVGIARDEVLHVAQSQYHDIGAAHALGLRTCWVERRHGQAGTGATPAAAVTRPDLHVHSPAELDELLPSAAVLEGERAAG
ncbi:HAD family hydrolase [Actinomycetospora corticicola]|uniref:Putative hydrolase of the HAD superfamily n=1 Tax=Actinomycetospora corticicola TaxID=663602 RepID=A0A7Y9DSJ5_9PSEU|nr:HAD-IA family hydrolase [Actinomycetospora corticicola]NYD34669.1 putative hydrolase of the HAD superfamily [Actinomycetospora corticicola]